MMTTKKMSSGQLGGSFRDPSGFLFQLDGVLYRQVNQSYSADYSFLVQSGLYEKLTKAGLLVCHKETSILPAEPGLAFKVIQPERLSFISYPYEWSFSELKDAALATLSIQKRALKLGMSLKDASAYNIQFQNGRPTLIDTLSFEIYKEGNPWVAYKQFCQHFLAPLALMAYTDVRLSQLMRIYIDGIPLDLASHLLPARTYFNFGLLTHLHIHAGIQKKYADRAIQSDSVSTSHMSKEAMLALVDSLQAVINKLEWKPGGTEWGDYYNITNYSVEAFEHKKQIIASWIDRVTPASVWDLGANEGTFSCLASAMNISTVAFDIDPTAVEKNYLQMRKSKNQKMLPLVLDLTNPSPSLGWHNCERDSLSERAPADMVFALAVIHHLAISNNVPLSYQADFFYEMGKWLVIEFVPKSDSQVQKLLKSRLDIFDQYTQEDFEKDFISRFIVHERINIRETERYLYLMERREHS